MVSAWERALARGEGPAAPVKRKYQDMTPAGRAELRRSVERKNLAPPPQPEPSTQQSAPQRPRWALPTGTPFITPSGQTPTPQDYAAAGQFAIDAALGSERESVLPGTQQAGALERFVRTQAGEEEFRLAGQRASEGRLGAAAGWGLLGLAGMVPLVGDVAQGLGAAGRAAGLAGDVARGAERAADVGRAPRITLRADDVERVQGIGNEHWFRVPDPDNPRARMTLPGSSGGGRLGGRPMTLDEVPDEIYHVTTNSSGIRADGMINVSRGGDMGAGGTSGSGAVSLSASREAAETLASDLRAYAELKTLATEDDVIDFLLGISRRDGMTQEGLSSLEEYLRRAAASSKGREAFVPEIHSKGIYDAWQFARGSRGGPNASIIIGNPFGDYWRTVRPEDIDIISVNKRQIPEGALINDYDVGRGALDEIQVYADIPLPRAAERAADVGRAADVRSSVRNASLPLRNEGRLVPLRESYGFDATVNGIRSRVKNAFSLESVDNLSMPISRDPSDAMQVFDELIEDYANYLVGLPRSQTYVSDGNISRGINTAIADELIREISERVGRTPYSGWMSLTPTEARKLGDVINNLDVTVATDIEGLLGFANSNRYLNAFESGRTGSGAWMPEYRKGAEEVMFGIPESAPASQRPVYGFLSYKPGQTPDVPRGLRQSISPDSAFQYGNIRIRFGPSVRDRSTMTAGDSIRRDYTPVPLADPSFENLAIGNFNRVDGRTYIETQIMGNPTFDEVIGIDAPEELVSQVRSIVGPDIPIYPY